MPLIGHACAPELQILGQAVRPGACPSAKRVERQLPGERTAGHLPPLAGNEDPCTDFCCRCCVSIAGSGLLAQRALLDQLPPEREACTFRHIGFGDEFTPLELPGEGVVRGLVRMGSRLWVARGDDLFGSVGPGWNGRWRSRPPIRWWR